MNDRIHDWLDGELPLEALSAEERAEARQLEAAVSRAADASAARSPGVAQRVMAALPPGPPPRKRSIPARLRALLRRPVALRPAVLAAMGLVIGFGLGVLSTAGEEGDIDTATPALASPEAEATATVYVRFDVQVPDAEVVELAGSFSDWQPRYTLTPSGENHWTVTVPLEPGVHDYVFVVDGSRQVVDPAAPQIADGFGSYNNRIALLAST